MAITKTVENDKIEVINKWSIQVRQATIIKEDGVEISKSYHRTGYTPYISRKDADGKWTHVDTDISKVDADVKAICLAAWTDEVKDGFKKWIEAQG